MQPHSADIPLRTSSGARAPIALLASTAVGWRHRSRSTYHLRVDVDRSFPCDIWRPIEPVGTCPIILLSDSSGGSGRRGYTFLANHLASHGYIVVQAELASRSVEAVVRVA